mmetsp:Transcript_13645/g.15890  ORF Transcript_13645/g.15890 Transcript_13645/m.15890 type:complete len:511 (-) Transcript_13645:154-1686(-)
MSDSLAQKPYAATIPRVTGIISAISSSLIIYLICRSENKLSTIYHRIIFAMSCADVIGSIAMALTTLPMPNEIICEEGEDYLHWDTRLGNIQTCEVQGFCVTFGVFTMYAYNGMLCVYYACAIAFQMKENNIRKCVEPFLHIAALAFGLGNSITALVLDNLNASNIDAWCTITTIRECQVRGVRDMSKAIEVQIFFLFSLILTSFGLIIWKTFKIDRALASVSRTQIDHNIDNNDGDKDIDRTDCQTSTISQLEDVVSKHQTTKIVVKQALAYIMTLLLCLIFPLIRVLAKDVAVDNFAAYMQLYFMPLQGFFNFLIFIGHKIYNYKRVYGEEAYCTILRKYFCESDMAEPLLFSSLSIIEIGINDVEVSVNDEVGELRSVKLKRRGELMSSKLKSRIRHDPQSEDELSSNLPTKKGDILVSEDMFDDNSRFSVSGTSATGGIAKRRTGFVSSNDSNVVRSNSNISCGEDVKVDIHNSDHNLSAFDSNRGGSSYQSSYPDVTSNDDTVKI